MANLKRFTQEHINCMIEHFYKKTQTELIILLIEAMSYDDILDILHKEGHITGRYGETI